MSREVHVRFWESAGVQFLRATHLPLYRQEAIFERAGMGLSRSTLAQWVGACGVQLQPLVDALKAEMPSRTELHADETPVRMLKPGNGKTHRAYLWSYGTTAYNELKAVVFDFAETRGGRHAQAFLGVDTEAGWRGTLICDDYAADVTVKDMWCPQRSGVRRLTNRPVDTT